MQTNGDVYWNMESDKTEHSKSKSKEQALSLLSKNHKYQRIAKSFMLTLSATSDHKRKKLTEYE